MEERRERAVTVAGRPVRLTPIEYELLAEFSVNAGRVLGHQQLLQRAYMRKKDRIRCVALD